MIQVYINTQEILMANKRAFDVVHPCFVIEKESIETVKKIIARNQGSSFNDRPSISSFIRDAVYEKIKREVGDESN